jgi:hypothetical protein
MGGSKEEIESHGGELNGHDSTKTHHVGVGEEKDRGGFTCTLGCVPGSEEESGVGPIEGLRSLLR